MSRSSSSSSATARTAHNSLTSQQRGTAVVSGLHLSEAVDGVGNPQSAETAVIYYELGCTHYLPEEDANAVLMLRRVLAVGNAKHITRCNASRHLCNCGSLVDAEAQCHTTFKHLEEASDARVLLSSCCDYSEIRANVQSTLGMIHGDCNRLFEALLSVEKLSQCSSQLAIRNE